MLLPPRPTASLPLSSPPQAKQPKIPAIRNHLRMYYQIGSMGFSECSAFISAFSPCYEPDVLQRSAAVCLDKQVVCKAVVNALAFQATSDPPVLSGFMEMSEIATKCMAIIVLCYLILQLVFVIVRRLILASIYFQVHYSSLRTCSPHLLSSLPLLIASPLHCLSQCTCSTIRKSRASPCARPQNRRSCALPRACAPSSRPES